MIYLLVIYLMISSFVTGYQLSKEDHRDAPPLNTIAWCIVFFILWFPLLILAGIEHAYKFLKDDLEFGYFWRYFTGQNKQLTPKEISYFYDTNFKYTNYQFYKRGKLIGWFKKRAVHLIEKKNGIAMYRRPDRYGLAASVTLSKTSEPVWVIVQPSISKEKDLVMPDYETAISVLYAKNENLKLKKSDTNTHNL